MNPATRDVFDDWARRGRDLGMEAGHKPRAVQAIAALELRAGERALDLGCGNGWAARLMAEAVGEEGSVVGIDIAPEMVTKATEGATTMRGLSFVEAGFEELPFADASFDAAFSMEALYYASDLDRALDEILRVLRPGGRFAFCTDFFLENPHCHSWPEAMGIPMALFGEREWEDRFRTRGFTLERSFRCLDPRPVGDQLPAAEARDLRDFRERIGALALIVSRPA